MDTDWPSLLSIAALALLVVWVVWWIGREADRNMELLRRRFVAPQREAVEGTGVERAADTPVDASSAGFGRAPRSPQAPAGVADPRPAAPAGLHFPAGAASPPDAPRAASAGFRPRRVTVRGC